MYTSYVDFQENKYLELLTSLISFSEKTMINGTSETLIQVYDAQLIYQKALQPIIEISFQYNETLEQHFYGLLYSNVETDELNRSVLRLNLCPVHKSFRRKFSRSFSNNATQTITDCMTALYNDMKLITPVITASNVRIPPACLSGTYETVFDYIRDNGQSVDSSDFIYLWEDGSGIYLKSNKEILSQTPIKGYKYNVSNPFIGDALIFTTAEYITHKDNTTLYKNASFYSFSMTDKKMYSDILADTELENSWIMVNRNAVYSDNFQNPDSSGNPFQCTKCQVLSGYEKRIKFDVNQGRMDLKVGALIEVIGDEYSGNYMIVECVRDVSKDLHLQTLECVEVTDPSSNANETV